jgi:single-strand DNA-binding protein
MNNCSFIGRIGRDAELRHTQSGKEVTSWPLAVDVGYGQNKSTLWLDCAMWGERGMRLVEYIRKGERIGVHGEISQDTYHANDGSEKSRVRLRVADVTLLGSKQDGHSGSQGRQQSRAEPAKQQDISRDTADDFGDDRIPF